MKDKLGNNFITSKVRLDSLFRSKINDPNEIDFAQKYYDIINEQEKLGIIERVSNISGNMKTNKGHYIPHHGVFKDGSPKLRVVMNGSANTETGVCLNDCLSPGPPLTNELIEMVMRFRTHEYIITGDIEKAFLQLEVADADRDFLRFLWYDKDGKLVIYRFTRVPFGLRCSSFLLNATLRYHMQKKCLEINDPYLYELLNKSQYVDDWIIGACKVDEVLHLKSLLSDFLEPIGMKLHKFNSNSEEIRESFAVECPQKDAIFGLQWDVLSDEIFINIDRALRKMKN